MKIKDYQEYISSLRNIYAENTENLTIPNGITDTVGNINFTRQLPLFTGFQEKFVAEDNVIVHSHPYYEMHFIKKNSAQIIINDKAITLMPNDALIIAPDIYHHYLKPAKPITISTTQFFVSKNKLTAKPDYYDLFIAKLKECGGYYHLQNAEKIIDFLQAIADYCSCSSKDFIMDYVNPLFHLVFTELTVQLCQKSEKAIHNYNTVSESDFQLNTIQSYIFSNYFSDPTLSDLAKILGLSEKQVSRIIKKYYGIDFKTQIMNLRLQNAKRLIKETSESLEDISLKVGFSSYSGFHLAFKKKYEITPGEYRRIKQQAQSEK